MQVLPDITANKFFILCVDSPRVDPSQIPPMGGQVITVGTHNGNNYVCADIQEMLHGSGLMPISKTGIHSAFHLIGIPDVICSELTDAQIPPSNQSVISKE